MFCSPPGRASAQLGPGRVKILRLAFQVTTASQQKKTPLFVFTSAPPATGQLLSRLITQPLAWLDLTLGELGRKSITANSEASQAIADVDTIEFCADSIAALDRRGESSLEDLVGDAVRERI